MKTKLTDHVLRSLQRPHEEAREIWDTALNGFGVRATAQGTVAFFVKRRPRGRRDFVRLTLGRYPLLGLSDARQRARDALRRLEDGIDPREEAAEQARIAKRNAAHTFAAVAEAFIARHVVTKRSARSIEQLIRRELIPRWGERPITTIKRADVIELIDEIVDRGHPEAAHTTLAYTRRLFSWAVARDYGLEHAPTDHVSAKELIGAKAIRKRVLSDAELALVWRATEDAPVGIGSYARLLLLLGVRRCELGEAAWDEFALERATWLVPAGRMKADEPHSIPLPPAAVEILRNLPRNGARVFGSVLHYGRSKRALDARIRALNGGKALPRWTWHDARRTFRTGLSTIGIPPHVAELCIAHRQKGLARIYDQHRFDDEKRDAFAAWEQRLLRIVAPPAGDDAGNVVALKRKRS
jgi:integrase